MKMLTRWNDFGALSRFGSRDFRSSFDSLDELRRQMNRLFFDFENETPYGDAGSDAWPPVTLQDTGAALVIRADVPGLDPKSLDLNVDETTITLKGEREDKAPEGYTVHRKERVAYRFTRAFSLPAKIDAEKVEAEVKNGVLTITLAKAKEAQPRQINVRAS
jgi:HSP20 family protein